jgi:glycosyltransferase involved in cell wall biosynthesis
VSVGLPVYNGERYLPAALESHLAQTFEDFELIVCDNASTDRTGDIALSYAAGDRRVRYVRHSANIGAARNFNRAFELSGGEYFRWAAADDLFAPESLARCVDVLDRERSAVLVYPKTQLINDAGLVIGLYQDRLHLPSPRPSERFRLLLERLQLCNAQYGLMRSDAMRRTGLFGCYIGSDHVFLAELALHGTFWEMPEALLFRRLHSQAASSMNTAQLQDFWDPVENPRVVMTQWRLLWELGRAVQRASLPTHERVRLMYVLMRVAGWQRASLVREVSSAMRQLADGAFRNALR